MLGEKWINRIDTFGVWILLGIIFLFILTGYGTSKHLFDPLTAKFLHSRVLPVPLFVFFLAHILKPAHQQFKKWKIFSGSRWLDLYIYALAFVFLGLFLWLFFR